MKKNKKYIHYIVHSHHERGVVGLKPVTPPPHDPLKYYNVGGGDMENSFKIYFKDWGSRERERGSVLL